MIDSVHNGAGETQTAEKRKNAADLNIQERITKFHDMLSDEHIYRVPLKYFTDIGKINFPLKIDFRFKLHLETEMQQLFESRKVITGVATLDPDTKIIITKTAFIQYEQLLLDKNFRQYLETIMVSKKILRMETQKSPIQKTYEINVGADSIEIDFLESNRQFDWLEFSLAYDKSDQHATIYNSYNYELAAKTIKSIKLSNFTEIYSLTNEKKYSIDNLTQKLKNISSTNSLSGGAVTDLASHP